MAQQVGTAVYSTTDTCNTHGHAACETAQEFLENYAKNISSNTNTIIRFAPPGQAKARTAIYIARGLEGIPTTRKHLHVIASRCQIAKTKMLCETQKLCCKRRLPCCVPIGTFAVAVCFVFPQNHKVIVQTRMVRTQSIGWFSLPKTIQL